MLGYELTVCTFVFIVKQPGRPQTRDPSVKGDDSCLSDSGDSDEDYIHAPGEENSSNNVTHF